MSLFIKPSHIFRQTQYDQRAVSQSLSKTVGCILKHVSMTFIDKTF